MSGRTRGIVSRQTRLTIRQKPVRTARKSGSTWAQSFSRRRGARRSCISSGIVIIRGRFDGVTSSFRQARRSSVGMAASDEHSNSLTVADAARAARELFFAGAGRGLLVPLRRFLRPPEFPLGVPTRAMWGDTRPAVDHLRGARHADRPCRRALASASFARGR